MPRNTALWFAAVLWVFAASPATAQTAMLCTEASSHSTPVCFAQAVIDAMHTAHVAALVPLDTAGQSESAVGLGSAMLYQSSRQRLGIERALESLRPYASSPDSTIRKSALDVARGLLALRQVSFAADSALRDALDGMGGRTSEQAQRIADLQSRRHASASLLILATIGVTYTLLEIDPNNSQRSRLNITDSQRASLLRQLEYSFGATLEADPRTGQWKSDFVAAVQSLDAFLRQEWPTRPR